MNAFSQSAKTEVSHQTHFSILLSIETKNCEDMTPPLNYLSQDNILTISGIRAGDLQDNQIKI